eukprot:1196326-Prorocentrum_minimum.AAC.17
MGLVDGSASSSTRGDGRVMRPTSMAYSRRPYSTGSAQSSITCAHRHGTQQCAVPRKPHHEAGVRQVVVSVPAGCGHTLRLDLGRLPNFPSRMRAGTRKAMSSGNTMPNPCMDFTPHSAAKHPSCASVYLLMLLRCWLSGWILRSFLVSFLVYTVGSVTCSGPSPQPPTGAPCAQQVIQQPSHPTLTTRMCY